MKIELVIDNPNSLDCEEVAEYLEDYLVDLTYEDRSVGIFAIPDSQVKIIEGIIKALKDEF